MRPKTAQSFHPHERTRTTTTGYIYILTNPSFPQYGKLGYATDVKQRPAELNRSTAVPFAFRVYATYEVDSALSDKKLHSILDKLNPDLRSAEEVDGKRRIREFYAMPPEDAYAILDAIAEINGFHHRLKKRRVTTTAQQDEALARQIEEQHRERVSPFAFSKCGISEGAELEFCCRGNEHTGERCTVADDKHVRFQDEIWSLTALAKHLLGTRNSVAGPQYFKYNGAWLNAIHRRLENRE